MKRALLMVFVLLFLFQPHPTHALSCVQYGTIEEDYENYDGIVVARVDQVIPKKNHNIIKTTVSKSYKGIEQKELSFKEDMTWGNINGPSEVGVDYLFFLKKDNDEWENSLCSRSKEFAHASKELKYLKDKEIPLTVSEKPVIDENEGKLIQENAPVQEIKMTKENEERLNNSTLLRIISVISGCIIIILLYIFLKRRS